MNHHNPPAFQPYRQGRIELDPKKIDDLSRIMTINLWDSTAEYVLKVSGLIFLLILSILLGVFFLLMNYDYYHLFGIFAFISLTILTICSLEIKARINFRKWAGALVAIKSLLDQDISQELRSKLLTIYPYKDTKDA